MKKHILYKKHLFPCTLLLTSLLLWGCNNKTDENQTKGTETLETTPADSSETTDTSSEAADSTARSDQSDNSENSQNKPLEAEHDDSHVEDESEAKSSENNQSELEQALIRYQYAEILSRIIGIYELPDGTNLEEMNGFSGNMSDNSYAILDVDGDGLEELLVVYTTSSMAGEFAAVYSYDPETGTITQELMCSPYLEYYDNGIVIANASHNHSYGEFWPYSIYQYDASTSTYAEIANVETWDKEWTDTLYDYEKDEQIPFPTELDKDKDGTLFSLWTKDSEWYDGEYRYDEEDYLEWKDSYLGTANQLTPEYEALTYENFQIYVKDYFALLQAKKEETDPSTGTDIGLLFIMEDYSLTDISQMLSEEYQVTTNYPYAEVEDEWIGEYAHNDAFYFIDLNLGSIQYCDTKVEDITIYDLYPGIGEEEAIQKLTAYGFYQYSGDAENGYLYITGNGFGNVAIFYKAENGKLLEISISPYCAYAG